MLKRISLVMLSVLLVTSCRFSEECNYTGSVEITSDWESLWGNLQKPDSLIALFYRDGDIPIKKRLFGSSTDTLYTGIPSGNTDMVVYNQPDGVQSRDLKYCPVQSYVYLHTLRVISLPLENVR